MVKGLDEIRLTKDLYVGDEKIFHKHPTIIGVDKTYQVQAGEIINFQVYWSYQEDSRKKKEEFHFCLEVFRDSLNVGSDSRVLVDRYRGVDKSEGLLTVPIIAPVNIGLQAYQCRLKCEDLLGAWEQGIRRGQHGRIMAPSEYESQEKAEKNVNILLDVYSIWSRYFLSVMEIK